MVASATLLATLTTADAVQVTVNGTVAVNTKPPGFVGHGWEMWAMLG